MANTVKTISLTANEEKKILVDKYNVKITNFTSDNIYISIKQNITAGGDEVKVILPSQSDGYSNLFNKYFYIKSNSDGIVQIESANNMNDFFKLQNSIEGGGGGGTSDTYSKNEIDNKLSNKANVVHTHNEYINQEDIITNNEIDEILEN